MDTNVLVIEDNVIALDELEYRLLNMGYNVETAVNGNEAIEKVKMFNPDIILSDINLGDGIDGIEAVNEINKDKHIPVIYVTAYDDKETLERANTSDPYGYIVKPVKERELRIAVDIALNKNKTENMLREMNTVKNRLLSVLGHDLAGPYASINGLSKILKESVDEFTKDELKQYIDLIYDSSFRGVNLSRNIMQWSRSQMSGLAIQKTTNNLFLFVDLVLSDHKELFVKKDISVFNIIDTNISVEIDENIIELVMRNLLTNASKFTPEKGKIKIASTSDEENKLVTVTITDTGIGMTPEQVKSLFSNEGVTPTLGTNKEKGNGLGLMLCIDFIEKHGNSIWVESQQGKGTSFSFTLPLAESLNPQAGSVY